jgi:hypothetical protein
MTYPKSARHSEAFLSAIRQWMARTYPDLQVPRAAVIHGGSASARRSARASANADRNVVRVLDPNIAQLMSYLGRGGRYTGGMQNTVGTGLHEMLHLEGPRYGDNRNDRFLEEGLAEQVATDMGPGFAGTLPYAPQPARRFEDGSYSNPAGDFRFRPDSYQQGTAAIRNFSFYDILNQLGAWEGLEDPNQSPEAMDSRRALLHMNTKQRRAKYAQVQRKKKKQREQPDYLPKTARSVGKVVSAAANIPRDPIAAAAQQVGRTTRSAGRSTPSAVRRQVNAHRGGY